VPRVQQSECDLQVAARHPASLRNRPHGMVKMGTGIPDGIPDTVGDLGDAVPAVMQQQHVKVTTGQQFLAAVAAHRDQGNTGLSAQHSGQPSVCFCSPPATISRK